MRRTVVAVAVVVTMVVGACTTDTGVDRAATGGSGSSSGPEVTVTSSTSTEASTTLPPTTVTTTTAPITTLPPTTVPPTTTTLPPQSITEPPGPLQGGSVGVRTMVLQKALAEQFYDPGEADGRFGVKTTMSVWAFQALFGMPRDGIVTPELEQLILARPAQAMLRPELGPTHVEIDLTRQVMLVWRDGNLKLVTHVSSGSEVPYCERTREGRRCGSAVTPLGVYQFGRRVSGWRDAPLGRLYNPVYFNGGIAVHGAGSVPNRPASHGCVRIPMHVADYFPALVETGDLVEVFRS